MLVPANYNCPGQIVISGNIAAVQRAEAAWAARGGRCVRLAIAGAFHSPLMAEAADEFRAYLQTVTFQEPVIPLVCNVDAQPLNAVTAREHLVRHLVEPVQFEQSVRNLVAQGCNTFIETGFGGVLQGFVRRIDKTLERVCVQDCASLQAVIS